MEITKEKVFEEAKRGGKPERFGNEFICNVCGKSWDLVEDDLNYREYVDFLEGKGCPSCIK